MECPGIEIRSISMSTEDRWERIASGLFWVAWLFVVFTAFGIYSRDDWRGIVMTAAPAAVLFAGWWLARARAEYLMHAGKQPVVLRVVSTLVIVAGAAAVIYNWTHPRVIYVDPPEQAFHEIRVPPGVAEKLRARARAEPPADPTMLAPEGCEDWVREPDQAKPGEMIGYCKRWAAK